MTQIFLNVLSIFIIVSSILVIRAPNPIHSVLFLITAFINGSVFLIVNGMNYIRLTYLVVYVGAIAILFLFVIMMLNVKYLELRDLDNDASLSSAMPFIVILGILFTLIIYGSEGPWYSSALGESGSVVRLRPHNGAGSRSAQAISTNYAGVVETESRLRGLNTYASSSSVSNIRTVDGFLNSLESGAISKIPQTSASALENIGLTMFCVNPIWIIIASLVLLLAMIGPIVLASTI